MTGLGLEMVRLLDLTKITDPRGNLTFIEGRRHVPFDIKRVYYMYDIPGGETRGGHSHWQLEELVIAASGSFEVVLDDGYQRQKYLLNRSYRGLYVPSGVWVDISNFSSGSVCLVLASDYYDETDYCRDYTMFLDWVNGHVSS